MAIWFHELGMNRHHEGEVKERNDDQIDQTDGNLAHSLEHRGLLLSFAVLLTRVFGFQDSI
jgi:hypothetical protein